MPYPSFTLDEFGDVRRCHFISQTIGNIYEPDFGSCFNPRNCTAAVCDCHIGYVHRPALKLEGLCGQGLLERIPSGRPEVSPRFAGAS